MTLVSWVGAAGDRSENAKKSTHIKAPLESLTKVSAVKLVDVGIRGLIL